jgi:hypothetical protein
MGKYLVLWEMDQSRIPVDPKERGAAWMAFLGLVKQDLETGTVTEWGAFVGETKGYAIHEGTEVEVAVTMQQYVPFACYEVHPISTLDQVKQVTEALLK